MGKIWELDFYSRPITDENKKKVWEVLICESSTEVKDSLELTFRYAQFCPNNQVNSVWLRNTIEEAISQAGYRPQKIRFFRIQMKNMIAKACEDAAIPGYASRRTFNLKQWIAERIDRVYPEYPSFTPIGPNPSVLIQSLPPQPLPDALKAEQWAFVTLEAWAFEEMNEWEIGFGEAFPLQARGIKGDDRIPGTIFFSARALPLAAWISGLELAYLKFESGPSQLLLETGANESWVLANIKDPSTIAEAKRFEEAKQKAKQIHFLAVQSDPQAESFAGFWLLQEIDITKEG